MVIWGYQQQPVVEGVRDFVAPSSSGLVRMSYSNIVDIYRIMVTNQNVYYP